MLDLLGTALDYGWLFVREWWLLLVIVGVAVALPPFTPVAAIDRLGRRRVIAGVAIAATSLSLSIGVAAVSGVPLPLIHDDYSCLLGGQMFASGYAAYATPPQWQHFETFHVLLVPSYASKYPIGQQLLLALGIRLFDTALAGSWLAAAAASVAIYWAMLAALPPAWAFAGGVAAALHPLMLNWSSSYRGGGLAALGGALLFGAMLRLARPPDVRDAVAGGVGLALLVISRPYEGFVLAIACGVAFLLLRSHPLLAYSRAAIVALVPLAIAFAGVAVHNRVVTGAAHTMPWVEYARQYEPLSPFVWGGATAPKQYRNEEMRFTYATLYAHQQVRLSTLDGFLRELQTKLYRMRMTLAGDPENHREAILWPLFFIPFAALPAALREERLARAIALVLALFVFAPLSIKFAVLTHYVAPAAAVVATVWMLLVRRVASHRRGRWLVVAIAIVFVINSLATCVWWTQRRDGVELKRRAMVASAGPGRHLFLVAPDVFGMTWNEPDLERARVIWARDLGDNAALLAHYRGRTRWRVEKEGEKLRLRRLPPPQLSQSQK